MGLHRYFTLSVFKYDENIYPHDTYDEHFEAEIISSFINENENAEYALNEDGTPNSDLSWFDVAEELAVYSKKHPNALFQLECEGQSNDDCWLLYCVNGKIQEEQRKISYGKFNPKKLKKLKKS